MPTRPTQLALSLLWSVRLSPMNPEQFLIAPVDYVLDISAARAGLEATALLILEDHVNGCVREAIEEGKGEEKATELLEAVGRFARSV